MQILANVKIHRCEDWVTRERWRGGELNVCDHKMYKRMRVQMNGQSHD